VSGAGLRDLWARDRALRATWLTLPCALGAEIIARQGWDAVVVDLQHGAIDSADALALLQAVAGSGTRALARAPWNDPAALMKLLDLGFEGLICPMIEGPDDARRFVQACLYPPLGQRSWGPVRAGLDGAREYARQANQRVLPIVQVETRGALEELDEILAIPGLGGVFVGPNDLAWALGHGPGSDREEPELLEIMARVALAARQRGVVAGLHVASGSYARRMEQLGYRLLTLGSDASFMGRGGRAALADLAGES